MDRLEDVELSSWLREAGIDLASHSVVARALRPDPESFDGGFRLTLSSDASFATLRVRPPMGRGRRVRREAVEAEISSHGWRGALDEVAIARALAYAPPPAGAAGWTILRGVAPRPGSDARFAAPIGFERIDESGGKIGRWISATEGTPGRSLLGLEIPAAPGRDRELRLAEGLRRDPDGTIVASGCGRIEVEEGPDYVAIDLVRSFSISGDVASTSGERDEPGDLEIFGNVLAGATVRARGRIVVRGCVEGARLEAQDGIEVGGGIRGAAEIHAGGDVRCAFAEFARIRAEGDVVARRALLHADVAAGGWVRVEDEHHGTISGGVVRAGRGIRAAVVGAPSETSTILSAGTPPEIETCDAVLRESRALLARDRNLLLVVHGKSERITSLLEGEIRRLEARVHETAGRREEILRGAEANPTAVVEVARTAHAGVLIRIGRFPQLLRVEESATRFRLDTEACEIIRRN